MDKKLNLSNPQTFNEKLQWLKLYNRKPEYTQLVDKIAVKDWVANKIGDDYIIPTFATWDTANEVNIDKLPDKFVLKCNHSGGNCGVFLVNDKNKFNIDSARSVLAKTLKKSVYSTLREWPYKNVKHRILAEMNLGSGIEDYKFFCYNGKAESVMVCYERATGHPKFYFFDHNWNLKRYNVRGKQAPKDFTMPKPKNIDKMFEIASKLSEGIPFVRVDLYNIDGQIYFGEMTFFPASGVDANLLPETDILFGNFIELPQKQ